MAGGAIVLALLAPIHFMLPASWRRPAARVVHLPSSVMVIVAMLALVGGAATVREGALGYAGVTLGIALLIAFVLAQRRLERPLLNVPVLAQNHVLRNALVVQWLLYCNAFGTVFLLSLYMQTVLGRTPETAGGVLAIGTLLMAAIAPSPGSLPTARARRSSRRAALAWCSSPRSARPRSARARLCSPSASCLRCRAWASPSSLRPT